MDRMSLKWLTFPQSAQNIVRPSYELSGAGGGGESGIAEAAVLEGPELICFEDIPVVAEITDD